MPFTFGARRLLCVCAGFANEGQFLLMNSASLADMSARIAAQVRSHKDRTASNPGHLSRFRPNLLVGGASVAAYAEDKWQQVRIGTHDFFTAGQASNAVLGFMLHALVRMAVHEAQPNLQCVCISCCMFSCKHCCAGHAASVTRRYTDEEGLLTFPSPEVYY